MSSRGRRRTLRGGGAQLPRPLPPTPTPRNEKEKNIFKSYISRSVVKSLHTLVLISENFIKSLILAKIGFIFESIILLKIVVYP
jgi:hypothetical protein